MDVVEVCTDEDFSNIIIPEFVGLGVGDRIGNEVELLIGASHEDVEVARCPACPDLCAVARRLDTHVVFRSEHGSDVFPKLSLWVGAEYRVFLGKLHLEEVFGKQRSSEQGSDHN